MFSKDPRVRAREIDEIQQCLNLTDGELWKKINRTLIPTGRSELLNDIDLMLLYAFRKPKHPHLVIGLEDNWFLRLYLQAVQITLCDKRSLCKKLSAPDFPTDPVQAVAVLRAYIDQSYSIFFQRRVSSTLLAVLIIRLGAEKFCGCSQATNTSDP